METIQVYESACLYVFLLEEWSATLGKNGLSVALLSFREDLKILVSWLHAFSTLFDRFFGNFQASIFFYFN